jgi:hypothetical protein
LEVAKKLGLPVFYVVTNDTATIVELEASHRRWSLDDYLTAFHREGSADYSSIVEWGMRTGIPLSCCASMLHGVQAGSANVNKIIKSGKFKVKDELHIFQVANICDAIKRQGHEWAVSRNFVNAVSMCVFCQEFDTNLMIEKTSANLGLLRKQGSTDQYLDMIESIYNSRSKNRVPIAFLAKNNAKARAKAKIAPQENLQS